MNHLQPRAAEQPQPTTRSNPRINNAYNSRAATSQPPTTSKATNAQSNTHKLKQRSSHQPSSPCVNHSYTPQQMKSRKQLILNLVLSGESLASILALFGDFGACTLLLCIASLVACLI
jgi:hypothetical protein